MIQITLQRETDLILMELPPPIVEPPTTGAEPVKTSVFAKLMNIVASPGEVFDEIRTAPSSAANWLLPLVLMALFGIISSCVMFSQPTIQQQIREQQEKAFDKQVAAGKMTRQQADDAAAMMEKFRGPALMMAFGSIAVTVGTLVHVLWWGFLLWLLARFGFHTPWGYGKMLELAGLPVVITALGAVVALLLGVIMGKMFAAVSLGLLVKDFDVTSKAHAALGAVNLFYLWQYSVMALGLARFTRGSTAKAFILVFGCLILEDALFLATPWPQMAL